MEKIKLYQIDAFTDDLFSGNPAAVCPLDDWLPDKVMQSIALENNLSETAFFIKKNNKFFIRWFTPTVEMDLCGHATLAAAHVIYTEMNYQNDKIEFDTKFVGLLSVTRNKDIFTMNFPGYDPKKVDQKLEDIHEALGVKPKLFLFGQYGLAIFDNEEEIIKMKPDFNKIINLSYNGITVTAPGENVDFVSRFFGPKLGIPEDPVTGGAHCDLTPYWSKRLNKKDMIANQLSNRGGVIYCSYLGDRVCLGGKATTYMRGEILLNINKYQL